MNLLRLLVRALAIVVGVSCLSVLGSTAPVQAEPGGDPDGPKPMAAMVDASLSGTVSTADGGPLDATLAVYQWDTGLGAFTWYDESLLEAPGGSAPYSFTVPTGSYYLQAESFNADYLDAFSGGAPEPPLTPADPGVVEVTEAGATADLQLPLAPARQSVTGTVVDPGGTPVPDVFVEADGPSYDDDFTSLSGSYELSLRPGSYTLTFSASEDHEGASVEIVVGEAPLSVDPVTVAPAGRWGVTGEILDSDSQPLAGATVTLYRLVGDPVDGWWDADWVDEATTAADGSYSFTGVRGQRYYTVQAAAADHSARYLGGVRSVEDAGLGFVHLTADAVLPDLALPLASSVSGTVTGPDGPEAFAGVTLYRWYDGSGWEEEDWSETAEDGTYRFGDVAPGSYTLHFSPGSESLAAAAWLEGSAEPSGPDAAGTFEVTATPAQIVKDKTLASAQKATGRVTDQGGNPLADTSVTAYEWNGTTWSQGMTATTGDNGQYAVRLPEPSSTVTFRFARGGFDPQVLGGGRSLPASPSAENSRVVPATGDLTIGDVALAPFDSRLGTVAGQELDYCLTHVLPANDDGSTEEVPLPFQLKFYGDEYSGIYVNNNGNVTFGSPQSTYTPSALNGATARPIIAPFFADVDTRGAGSNVVTYGASPDGRTFCVNWADVGYFGSHDDKLNTFQLLLTSNTTGAGRSPGDFDIRFNYDEILWETGDASNGTNGFGGTSAAVGFSAGTGDPGSFVQLPGSLVNGALLDGGPDALVANSQNSTQAGRYNFEVRNDGFTTNLGGMTGTVEEADGDPIADAYVQACTAAWVCAYTGTNAAGEYSFTALRAGAYTIEVWPPSAAYFGGGATATVVAGETTSVPPIVLAAPLPMPDGVELTNNGVGTNGVPSVYYGDPLELQINGCPGVTNPTYTVTLSTGEVIRDALPLTETAPGVYEATIAPFSPHTGDATISTNVPLVCGADPVVFNVYIDPAGTVTDQYGRPITGATVTLFRSETADGEFQQVPDGSDIMSESNRDNPDTTNADGYFQWLVIAGFYKVTATAAGCDTVSTGPMQILPERTALVLALTCDVAAPTPTAAPEVTGTAGVGGTITAVDGTWAAPLESDVELLRDGEPLPEDSYTLTAEDVGAEFTARSTGSRPDAVSDAGPDADELQVPVQFADATATSEPVTGQKAASKTTLTLAKKTIRDNTRASATVKVTVPRGVVAAGKVAIKAGAKVVGSGTLRGGKATIRLAKLRAGTYKLVASYGGSPSVAGSKSGKVTLRVLRAG